MSPEPRLSTLIAEGDKCVMCGMCLPQCPTYTHAQDENESPRGRVVLGKALLRGELKVDTTIRQHIDNCLLCRQCERICPSGVRFGYFMDGLRQHIRSGHKPVENKLERLLEDYEKGRRLNHLLRVAQGSGAFKVAGLLPGKLGRLARSVPTVSRISALQDHHPARTPGQQVRLFRGCTQTVFGSALFDASIRVLNRLGVSVDVPAEQGCCGALSQHNGDAQRADSLAAINLEAFNTESTLPIITLASGCAASLKDYARFADGENYSRAQIFAQQVTDISQYLLSVDWPTDVNVQPLSKRIVVHSPCSLRNVLRQEGAVTRLMARIPAAEVLPLEAVTSCCGAAGSYMFDGEHHHLSDILANKTVEQIRRLDANLVVSSNIGCAMQLQAGLKRAGLAIRVLHPVELLAQQLGLD